MNRPLSKIFFFLVLTLALSAAGWTLSLGAGDGSPSALLYVVLTMLCPGIAAILTRLLTQGNLTGMGWTVKRPRFRALGYAIPIGYALPVYAIAWAAGLGRSIRRNGLSASQSVRRPSCCCRRQSGCWSD